MRRQRELIHRSASGVSGVRPMAPNTCMARSTTWFSMPGTTALIMAISLRAPLAPTLSIIQAVFSTSSRACSISIRERAIHSEMLPC